MRILTLTSHAILITGVLLMAGPTLWLVMSSLPGFAGLTALTIGFSGDVGLFDVLSNSLTLAAGVALVSTLVAFLAASVLVFAPVPGVTLVFWLSLLTLLYPVEARMIPTRQVLGTLGLISHPAGMILPVVNTAIGMFFFRQRLRQIPREVVEAARLDGAGPLRITRDIVLPAALPAVAAVFTVTFVIGWNQYLWPLMLARGPESYTGLVAVSFLGAGSAEARALAVLLTAPPLLLAGLLFARRLQ
ncbi:MAG: carbohydrate ABC transporter permease [Pseudomonadota bacterium]